MSRTSARKLGIFAASIVASVLALPVYGQLGHRVVHDWTIGIEAQRSGASGYAPDFRRVGLIEYEGDVDGTYVTWGFGGVMTDHSATTIVSAAGGALAMLVIAGALTTMTLGRRGGRKSRSTES